MTASVSRSNNLNEPRPARRVHVRVTAILATATLVVLGGCVVPPPVTGEPRTVQPMVDPTKAVTLRDRMIWYENVYYPPRKGIQFPPGRYALEAEDAEYWYLRSPAPLELWTLEHGRIAEVVSTPGGLMLAKRFMGAPAAGYVDGEASDKQKVWDIGSDFRSMEGKYWTRNF